MSRGTKRALEGAARTIARDRPAPGRVLATLTSSPSSHGTFRRWHLGYEAYWLTAAG
jgi:hypothetical protein